MRQDSPHEQHEPHEAGGARGVVFSVADAAGRALEREICSPDPEAAIRYFDAARGGGRPLYGLAWRCGPLHPWRAAPGGRVPALVDGAEARRVQGCAYRCLAGWLRRCGLPRLAAEASLARYGGYFRDLEAAARSLVELEIASPLVRHVHLPAVVQALVARRAVEAFTVPRYPGDEADALPPGIFLMLRS